MSPGSWKEVRKYPDDDDEADNHQSGGNEVDETPAHVFAYDTAHYARSQNTGQQSRKDDAYILPFGFGSGVLRRKRHEHLRNDGTCTCQQGGKKYQVDVGEPGQW